jgi:hypothetical protein
VSCEACSFPYSLCQCPAVITVGELAILRIDLRTAKREVIQGKRDLGAALRAYDAVVLSHREEVARLHAELGQLRANLAATPVRVVTLEPDGPTQMVGGRDLPRPASTGGLTRAHCAFEDCDQEPDSTGYCERHADHRVPDLKGEVKP